MNAPRRARMLGPIRVETTSDRATVVATLAAAILALAIVSPSLGGRPVGDPSLFAADARFERCGGGTVPTRYAFEIPRTRDYRDFLPEMPGTSELELDDPALVVIFEGVGPFVSRPTAQAGGSAAPRRTSAPGIHDVCIYVGEAGQGQLNYYRDIPIGGLRATPEGPTLEPLTPSAPTPTS